MWPAILTGVVVATVSISFTAFLAFLRRLDVRLDLHDEKLARVVAQINNGILIRLDAFEAKLDADVVARLRALERALLIEEE
jgi:hypothetical protein